MGTQINKYVLTKDFSTNDAGNCQWGFAIKDEKEFFIKQFLSVKYPIDKAQFDSELLEMMQRAARRYCEKQTKIYRAINMCDSGNIVVIREFFRSGTFYYVTTDKISGPFLSVEEVSRMDDSKKRILLKAILYSFMLLHEQHIVHSDIKPENLLVIKTANKYCTGKLIDFDASFFEDDVPEEIQGDQRYFSPEAVLYNQEIDIPVTCKADIFALGILFHQYWTGEFPFFDERKYGYPCNAVLNGEVLLTQSSVPDDIRELLTQMMEAEQDDRPTAREALSALGWKPETNSFPPKKADQVDTGLSESSLWKTMEDDDL